MAILNQKSKRSYQCHRLARPLRMLDHSCFSKGKTISYTNIPHDSRNGKMMVFMVCKMPQDQEE